MTMPPSCSLLSSHSQIILANPTDNVGAFLSQI